MNKPKLAILIKGLGSGGAEQLLLLQCKRLVTQYQVEIGFVASDRTHLLSHFESIGAKVTLLSFPAILKIPLASRLLEALGIPWVFRLPLWFRKNEAVIVHSHSPLLASVFRIQRAIGFIPKISSVYTEHSPWEKYKFLTRSLNRLTISLEDQIYCVSPAVQASTDRKVDSEILIHGIETEKVADAYSMRDSVRTSWGVSQDNIVVGMLANFRPEKNHRLVFEAAKTIQNSLPGVVFVIYGQGKLENSLKQFQTELGLGENFKLMGYTSSPHEKLAGLDVLILVSSYEGMPVVLMEAACLGLPVIAARSPGIAEMFTDSEVHYCEELTASGIVQAINELCSGEELSSHMRSELSLQIAKRKNEFNVDHFVDKLVVTYHRLLAER